MLLSSKLYEIKICIDRCCNNLANYEIFDKDVSDYKLVIVMDQLDAQILVL